ncbi:MAG TPA: T9SS type A sorting domain-containing protein, partial [Candidatus Kapabacteria bacterium]|nr:T9SS type A sorting domain-containing protein [Candidatus Kapabacteria bacterium]
QGISVPTSVTCIIANGNDMYAGTWLQGVSHSTDNGATWTTIDSGLPAPSSMNVYALALSNNVLLAGTDHGLYISSNSGTSWDSVKSSWIYPECFLVNGNMILAGTYSNGVIRSTDNGHTWVEANNGITGKYNIKQVNTLCGYGNKVYAGAYEGVYVSSDNGDSWTAISNGLPQQQSPNIQAVVAVGNVLYAGTDNINMYVSQDGGANWAKANTGIRTPHAYFLRAINGTVYVGTNTGLFYSTSNGASWLPLNAGMANLYFRSLAMSDSVMLGSSFVQDYGGVDRSTDNGVTWTMSNKGFRDSAAESFLIRDTDIFAGVYQGGVYRSTDNGASWVPAKDTGLPYSGDDILALLSVGKYLLVGTGQHALYRSTNDGASWTLTSGMPANTEVLSLFSLGQYVYAGTYGDYVYRSSDSGATWTRYTTGLTAGIGIADMMFFDNKIYAGQSGAVSPGIVVSADSGETWSSITTDLTSVVIMKLAQKNGLLFVATSGGVAVSKDSGAHWSFMNQGFDNVYINTILVAQNDVYAGNNSTLWRRSLADFKVSAVTEKQTDVPQELHLSQNYPNPFNSTTTINYSLPGSENATLKVYNSLGEEIRMLVSGEQSTGAHSVVLNANDLQDGMYFYRLTAGKFSQSGKMIILR